MLDLPKPSYDSGEVYGTDFPILYGHPRNFLSFIKEAYISNVASFIDDENQSFTDYFRESSVNLLKLLRYTSVYSSTSGSRT